MNNYQKMTLKLIEWFPLWIVLGCLWAWWQPVAWIWFQAYIPQALGVIMLGMGLTLRIVDFVEILRMPGIVALGVFAQFGIMPMIAWGSAKLFNLEADLAIGLILVGCCPGGTASNVICYLARANVALSVLLTMCSTFAAVIMTPLLTKWLAGAYLPIDAWGLFSSMLLIVLLPLVVGLSINTALDYVAQPKQLASRAVINLLGPLVSVLLIVLVVGSIMAANTTAIAKAGWILFGSVFLLHVSGFTLGYLVMRGLGYAKAECRTVSVEVGMQNSGLAASLAKMHFAHLAMAPVPAAISAVLHCLIGSALAGFWRRRS